MSDHPELLLPQRRPASTNKPQKYNKEAAGALQEGCGGRGNFFTYLLKKVAKIFGDFRIFLYLCNIEKH
jgi:hypothetical protein